MAEFIVSPTVEAPVRKAYEIRILDALLPYVRVKRSLPEYVLKDDVQFVYGDVRHRTAWKGPLESVEAAFYFAAYQGYMPDLPT